MVIFLAKIGFKMHVARIHTKYTKTQEKYMFLYTFGRIWWSGFADFGQSCRFGSGLEAKIWRFVQVLPILVGFGGQDLQIWAGFAHFGRSGGPRWTKKVGNGAKLKPS